MALSQYTGQTPRGYDQTTTVERVAPHQRWDIDGERQGECSNCGSELQLREKHLLVTFSENPGRDTERHYLCGQPCLDEWLVE